ncbi:hypothetical protein [Clostridium formicaceticum]|nr:hypothetical protein [Clostridium formicaceticum]
MQIKVIFYHLILVFNAGVTYGFIYLSKELEEENIHLRKKVKALTQYEDASKLLTKQEFKERSSLIKKAMERRGEEGYEIYFHLKQQGIYAQYAVFYTLTNLALETFRNQYDLVGKWDDSSFVILLQNTDKEGMEIALNRYLSKVDEKLEMNQEELMIEMEVIAPEKEGVNIA